MESETATLDYELVTTTWPIAEFVPETMRLEPEERGILKRYPDIAARVAEDFQASPLSGVELIQEIAHRLVVADHYWRGEGTELIEKSVRFHVAERIELEGMRQLAVDIDVAEIIKRLSPHCERSNWQKRVRLFKSYGHQINEMKDTAAGVRMGLIELIAAEPGSVHDDAQVRELISSEGIGGLNKASFERVYAERLQNLVALSLEEKRKHEREGERFHSVRDLLPEQQAEFCLLAIIDAAEYFIRDTEAQKARLKAAHQKAMAKQAAARHG